MRAILVPALNQVNKAFIALRFVFPVDEAPPAQ